MQLGRDGVVTHDPYDFILALCIRDEPRSPRHEIGEMGWNLVK